jgi:hypothetical protein
MSTLYHYCNASAFASIIVERRIWLSSLSLSNDTMEGKIVGATFRGLIERSELDERTATTIMNAVDRLEEVFDGLGFCLSGNGDLLSQWRGYSQDGRGFSIGFSKEYLEVLSKKKDVGEHGFSLNEVIYDPEEHKNALQPIFAQVMADIEAGRLNVPHPPGLLTGFGDPAAGERFKRDEENYLDAIRQMMLKVLMAVFHLFTLKHQAFREEQEWRLISHLLKGEGDACDFRVSGDRLIPYRSFPLKALGIPAIDEVILGPKNATPEFVVSKLLLQNGFTGVSVKRSSATYR